MNSFSQQQHTPPGPADLNGILWKGEEPFPEITSLPEVAGITFHSVHKATEGVDQYWHEAGIAFYKGKLFAAWVNSATMEAEEDAVIRGRISKDGGTTWGEVFTIAPELPGNERWEYAAFGVLQDKLWLFSARCHSRWEFADPKMEGFCYNAEKDTWEPQGVLLEDFVACDEPRRMEDGRWILTGMFQGKTRVAISEPDDFRNWTVRDVTGGRRWPKMSPIIVGKNILAPMRNSQERDGTFFALYAFSEDGGDSWSPARESNLPMSVTKPFAGVLSTGHKYLINNIPATGWQQRDWLVIYIAEPGEWQFEKVFVIRGGGAPPLRFQGEAKDPQWSYPKAVESDGNLYLVYSVGKEDGELAVLPVSSLVG